MSVVTVLAIVLGIWGIITVVRHIAEGEAQGPGRTGAPPGGQADTLTSGRADDDEIDYEELRRAEEEVRDLDVNARPEDGFEGDDWGPGAPKKPPYH